MAGHEQRTEVSADGHKLLVQKIDGNGSCMFSAVAHQLFRHPLNSREHKIATVMVRTVSVSYLLQNLHDPMYCHSLQGALADWPNLGENHSEQHRFYMLVSSMYQTKMWGCGPVLKSIAECFSLRIVLRQSRMRMHVVRPQCSEWKNIVHLFFGSSSGSGSADHYDSVLRVTCQTGGKNLFEHSCINSHLPELVSIPSEPKKPKKIHTNASKAKNTPSIRKRLSAPKKRRNQQYSKKDVSADADAGCEPGSEPGSKPGSEPGSKPGCEPGCEPGCSLPEPTILRLVILPSPGSRFTPLLPKVTPATPETAEQPGKMPPKQRKVFLPSPGSRFTPILPKVMPATPETAEQPWKMPPKQRKVQVANKIKWQKRVLFPKPPVPEPASLFQYVTGPSIGATTPGSTEISGGTKMASVALQVGLAKPPHLPKPSAPFQPSSTMRVGLAKPLQPLQPSSTLRVGLPKQPPHRISATEAIANSGSSSSSSTGPLTSAAADQSNKQTHKGMWVDTPDETKKASVYICQLKVVKCIAMDGENITVSIHGKLLDHRHPLTTAAKKATSLEDLKSIVDSYNVCCGVPDNRYQTLWDSSKTAYIDHCGEMTLRANSCILAVESRQCLHCHKLKKTLSSRKSKVDKRHKENDGALHPEKKPFSARSREEMNETARTYSKKIKTAKKYRKWVNDRMAEMKNHGVDATDDQSKFITDTLTEKIPEMTEMQKLFWTEQAKALKCKGASGMRYHPMLIKLAIHLRHVAGEGYDELVDMGLFRLPSKSTIKEYMKTSGERQGIRHENLRQLVEDTEKKCPVERRYFTLILDEMIIRENLVFDNQTGELIGFIHIDEIEAEIKRMDEDTPYRCAKTATHMLTFMAKAICGGRHLKAVVAAYGTRSGTSEILYSRAWEVVQHLEMNGLKVMCVTGDGATPNRAFFAMCAEPSTKGKCGYRTVNMFSEELRPLFFMSDVPHLIKTLRNCLSSKTRKLRKNGQQLSWKYMITLYESTKHDTLREACKLTYRHIYPNSFDRMKTCLAMQALSSTTAGALEGLNDPNMAEFIYLLQLVDQATDCLNGSTKMEANAKIKPDRAPYTSKDDERLRFLEDTFLDYFKKWEEEVMRLPGKLTKTERKNMLLSEETLEGLEITIHSFVDMVEWLLKRGVEYINPRNLCQDDLEIYFGKQRKSNGLNNNPDQKRFLENDTRTRITGAISSQIKGNCKHHHKKAKYADVDNTPMQRGPMKRTLRC